MRFGGNTDTFFVPPRSVQIMKRVEAILYAATAEEGRQILMDTQQEFAGRVFLEEDEAAAQVCLCVGGVHCGRGKAAVMHGDACIEFGGGDSHENLWLTAMEQEAAWDLPLISALEYATPYLTTRL